MHSDFNAIALYMLTLYTIGSITRACKICLSFNGSKSNFDSSYFKDLVAINFITNTRVGLHFLVHLL